MSESAKPPRRHRRTSWRLAVPLVTVFAGGLFVTSAISSDGTDLRSENSDVDQLVRERAANVEELRDEVSGVREANRELANSVDQQSVVKQRENAEDLMPTTGFTEVVGPGMRIALDDAPRESDSDDVDPNLLVVHQQDIQAFVNALWASGAEAISLQGQRLISTTGIKCVGNTVVLDGVPYAPPYVIEAVGDVTEMENALNAANAVNVYKDYVEKYDLGLTQEVKTEIEIPAYRNTPDLQYAEPVA
ncbi:DUF881 domain-containing protein [Solicola gregarius]|uniref:DUF881 domain-containing protein n=1 Tax=Solicola gregarius TaxID=2908642 RepID=A0AA46YNA7_9ACTN|nr:DUF881 domain-containing protein [Solicola gregarius]UYM07409.1 DUF881 domain-containing protein [Solicola gregarius]